MEKIRNFIKIYSDELLYKVSWPSYSELQNSAILVLISSLIFAIIIGVMDFSFDNVMTLIYKSF